MKRQTLALSLVGSFGMMLIIPSAYAENIMQDTPHASVDAIHVPVGTGNGRFCQNIAVEDKDSGSENVVITLQSNIPGVMLEGQKLCVSTQGPIPLSAIHMQASDPDKNFSLFETTVDVYNVSSPEKTPENSGDGKGKGNLADDEGNIAGSSEILRNSSRNSDSRESAPKSTIEKDDTSEAGMNLDEKTHTPEQNNSGTDNSMLKTSHSAEHTFDHPQSDVKKAEKMQAIIGREREIQAKTPSPRLAHTGSVGQPLAIAAVLFALSTVGVMARRATRN